MIDHIVNQTKPAMKTAYPPYISARRPKGSRNAAETKAKALAGQTAEACGIERSLTRVGRMTLKPETKYS